MSLKTTLLIASVLFCLGMGFYAFAPRRAEGVAPQLAAESSRPASGANRPARSSAATDPSNVCSKAWELFRGQYDQDGDARVTRAEYPRGEAAFVRLDADQDGAVSHDDFLERDNANWAVGMKQYVDANGGPRVGQPAPAIQLKSTDGEEFDLASFRGKKPVALIFGSFT